MTEAALAAIEVGAVLDDDVSRVLHRRRCLRLDVRGHRGDDGVGIWIERDERPRASGTESW